MKALLFSAIFLCASGLMVKANVVTHLYTAQVQDITTFGDLGNLPNVFDGVTAGRTDLSGSFSYRTDVPPAIRTPTRGVFTVGPAFSVDLPSGALFDPVFGPFIIQSNAAPGQSEFFQLRADVSTFPPAGFVPDGIVNRYTLTLRDNDGAAFDMFDRLPGSLDLKDFEEATLFLSQAEFDLGVIVGQRTIASTITSLRVEGVSEVPLPATVWMFASALVMIGLGRRWFVRRPQSLA